MSSREFVLGLTAIAVLANGCAAQPWQARDARQATVAGAPITDGRAEAQPPDPATGATSPAPAVPVPATAPAPTATAGANGQATGAEPAPLPDAPPPKPEANESDREKRDPHVMRRFLGWAVLSVGVEAAIVAVATSIMIEYQKGIRSNHCDDQKVCDSRGKGAANTIDSIVPWNTGAWITAIAGVGAGLTLVLVSPRKEGDPETAITVSPTSSGAGLTLRGGF
jgi:hypothetical protein